MKLLVCALLFVIILEEYNCAPHRHTRHRHTRVQHHPHYHTPRYLHRQCRPCGVYHHSLCCAPIRRGHVFRARHHATWKGSRVGHVTENPTTASYHIVTKIMTIEEPVKLIPVLKSGGKTADSVVDTSIVKTTDKPMNKPEVKPVNVVKPIDMPVEQPIAGPEYKNLEKNDAKPIDKSVEKMVDLVKERKSDNFLDMPTEYPMFVE